MLKGRANTFAEATQAQWKTLETFIVYTLRDLEQSMLPSGPAPYHFSGLRKVLGLLLTPLLARARTTSLSEPPERHNGPWTYPVVEMGTIACPWEKRKTP